LKGGIGPDSRMPQKGCYLLEGLGRYNNDIIGSFEMCPCSPNAMIRQASEFIFDVLKWPNKPNKSRDYMDLAYNCI
jgi:hypothetical protein